MKKKIMFMAGLVCTTAVFGDDVPRPFKKLDKNKDLQITTEEWVNFVREKVEKKGGTFNEKKTLKYIKTRDLNGDGVVTLEEFKSTAGKK
jgi:Ca2+-binding EF-hand superfamily protein